MPRDTSIEAYAAVEASEFVDKTKWDVYRCLYEHGPLTQNEVWVRLGSPQKKDSYSPRFSVLVQMGVIADLGVRPCTVTHRKCHYYDVTSKLPEKPVVPVRKSAWACLVADEGYVSTDKQQVLDWSRDFEGAVIFKCRMTLWNTK